MCKLSCILDVLSRTNGFEFVVANIHFIDVIIDILLQFSKPHFFVCDPLNRVGAIMGHLKYIELELVRAEGIDAHTAFFSTVLHPFRYFFAPTIHGHQFSSF